MARNPWTLEVADAIADRHPTEMVAFSRDSKYRRLRLRLRLKASTLHPKPKTMRFGYFGF